MDIGERIRTIRLKKRLSQENLAEELDITTSAYGNIERNQSEVTIQRLAKIAGILNVTLSDLIGDVQISEKSGDTKYDEKYVSLLENYNALLVEKARQDVLISTVLAGLRSDLQAVFKAGAVLSINLSQQDQDKEQAHINKLKGVFWNVEASEATPKPPKP